MDLKDLADLHVARYNKQADTFSVQDFLTHLNIVRRLTIGKAQSPYKIFGIYSNRKEALEAIEEMKELQK